MDNEIDALGRLDHESRCYMWELRGAFGERVAGAAGGTLRVKDVNQVLEMAAGIDSRCGTTSQLFDASRIAGKAHLAHAARSALIAHATGRGFASSLAIELVCWAAAERQIRKAFEKVGLREGTVEVAVITLGASRAQVERALADIIRELRVERDDSVLELKGAKVKGILGAFGISGGELGIAEPEKLVLERISLLALQGG